MVGVALGMGNRFLQPGPGHDQDRRHLAADLSSAHVEIVIAGIVALLDLGRYLRRRKSAGSSAQPADEDGSSD